MDTIKTLQIEQIDAQTLLLKFDSIEEAIRAIKARHLPYVPYEEEILLTRGDVAKTLKISLGTVWAWSKKGILKSYRIGNHVRYRRSEVLEALIPIKTVGRVV